MKFVYRHIIEIIVVVAFMVICGLNMGACIAEKEIAHNNAYKEAVQIKNEGTFLYGMENNIGNAFVYGEIVAVDPVKMENIEGDYIYIEKVRQEYRQHWRNKTYTDSNGNKHTKRESYYEWNTVSRDKTWCNQVEFCGAFFSPNKFSFPMADYIMTDDQKFHVRYKYYGVKSGLTGTIYTELQNNTISDGSKFMKDLNIDQALDTMTSSGGEMIFWIFWIPLIAVGGWITVLLDNKIERCLKK